MADYMVISADSHANEPVELYDRLPEEYRARAPREVTIDGHRYLRLEGSYDLPLDAPNPLTEEDMRRFFRDAEEGQDLIASNPNDLAGGIDIPVRLSDLEDDGVSGEVIYPQGIFKCFASPDPGFQKSLTGVYNDWYHEIFGGHPDKFVASSLLPMVDVGLAIEEGRRVAGLGGRSFSVPVSMPLLPYNYPEYDPFWDMAEETGVPVAFHVFTVGPTGRNPEGTARSGPGEDLSSEIVSMAHAMNPLTHLVASGALERHPDMKFVLVEGGVGWLAWVLQTLDEMQVKRHMWAEPKLNMKPSEYFHRQGYATFGDDHVGLMTRHVIGVENLMWGSDYPHDEGTFPHSREVIERTFKDVPEDEKRKIVGENAAKLYGFSVNQGPVTRRKYVGLQGYIG